MLPNPRQSENGISKQTADIPADRKILPVWKGRYFSYSEILAFSIVSHLEPNKARIDEYWLPEND